MHPAGLFRVSFPFLNESVAFHQVFGLVLANVVGEDPHDAVDSFQRRSCFVFIVDNAFLLGKGANDANKGIQSRQCN